MSLEATLLETVLETIGWHADAISQLDEASYEAMVADLRGQIRKELACARAGRLLPQPAVEGLIPVQDLLPLLDEYTRLWVEGYVDDASYEVLWHRIAAALAQACGPADEDTAPTNRPGLT
jgi:hypothetical protein